MNIKKTIYHLIKFYIKEYFFYNFTKIFDFFQKLFIILLLKSLSVNPIFNKIQSK